MNIASGLLLAVLAVCCFGSSRAQTVDDDMLFARHELVSGLSYSSDRWDEYWEGTLKRRNGNIGTLTTQIAQWHAGFGLTERLSVLAAVPYVWTHASAGVLHDMEGFQDATLAGKYRLFDEPFTQHGSLRALVAVAGSAPLSDYTPDFLPLSIGTHSKRVTTRLTVSFRATPGWFVAGSTAYTWRDNVKLDRSAYFTQNRLFQTNEVEMPNVVDWSLRAGYVRNGLQATLIHTTQRTQGGGDIRRQDMPFVSNQADFSELGAMVSYALPRLPALELQLAYAYTLGGRNVGQSSLLTTGFAYHFDLAQSEAP